jgi:hypothetical protein
MRTDRLLLNKLGRLGILPLVAKAISLAPPQPEALERREMGATQASADAPPRRHGPFERLARQLRTRPQRDVGAYPPKAADGHDLGPGIRVLERDVPYPYF